MKITKLLLLAGAAVMISGCLVGNKISYNVQLDETGGGTAEVIIHDIRSDAKTDLEFEEDKSNLFEYMLKSNDFVMEMLKDGKYIKSREMFVEDGKLNGKVVYTFKKLSDFENLVQEDGYLYITLAPDDEPLSANGEILKGADYKRIMWSAGQKNLQFEMLIEPAASDTVRGLADFYEQNIKEQK